MHIHKCYVWSIQYIIEPPVHCDIWVSNILFVGCVFGGFNFTLEDSGFRMIRSSQIITLGELVNQQVLLNDERNPANQLIGIVYPMIYDGFYTSQLVSRISSINKSYISFTSFFGVPGSKNNQNRHKFTFPWLFASNSQILDFTLSLLNMICLLSTIQWTSPVRSSDFGIFVTFFFQKNDENKAELVKIQQQQSPCWNFSVQQEWLLVKLFPWSPKIPRTSQPLTYLEEHPSGCKWFITMVSFRLQDLGLLPFQNGHSWSWLVSGMILHPRDHA